MSSKDPNKKHYFTPIETDEEVSRHFSKFKSGQKFTLREEAEREELEEIFTFKSYAASANKIFLNSTTTGLLSLVKKSSFINKTVYVMTDNSQFKFLTIGLLKFNKDQSLYELIIKGKIWLAQQRKDYRLTIEPGLDVKLNWNDYIIPVIDISAGGISLKAQGISADALSRQKKIKSAIIHFGNQKLPITEMEVKNTWPDDTDPHGHTHFFGLRFNSIQPQVEENLATLINSEARGREIRKIISGRLKKFNN
ncbi:MAG: hypothetical protein ACPGJV_01520 [Bacteriovoracaceae bacterium]